MQICNHATTIINLFSFAFFPERNIGLYTEYHSTCSVVVLLEQQVVDKNTIVPNEPFDSMYSISAEPLQREQ